MAKDSVPAGAGSVFVARSSEFWRTTRFVYNMVRISERTAVGTVGRPVRRRLFHVQNNVAALW